MHLSRYNVLLPVDEEKMYVLMNNLSSAMDIIDDEVVNILKSLERGEDVSDTETLSALKRKGYVYETEEHENAFMNYRFREYEKKIKMSFPVFYLYPTYACNLRCSYCFQDHSALKAAVIDDECLKAAFETMDYLQAESPSKELPYFVIFGGEPLLKRKKQYEVIEKILRESNNRGWKPKIVSNGVDLEFYTQMLSSYKLEYIQVTVDGPEAVHNKRRISPQSGGTFAPIIRGVQKAVDNRIKVAIRINVDAENISLLPELGQFFIDQGWEGNKLIVPYLAPMRDISCMEYGHRLPEHAALHHIYNLYRNFTEMRVIHLVGWVGAEIFRKVLETGHLPSPQFKFCGGNMTRYCFDLNGDIYTCVDSAGVEEYKVGRFVPTLAIDEKALEAWRNRSIMQIPRCTTCKLAFVCGGGCTKLACEKEGDIARPFCTDVEDVLHESARFYYPHLKKRAEGEEHT